MDIRKASVESEDAVAAALTTAFGDDPVWGWAVPEPPAREAFWRFMARNGIANDLVWVLDEGQATALWAPPGTVELDEAGEVALEHLCRDLPGEGAHRVMDVFESLDSVHPAEPHHYLSLLATHEDHRGRGLGMALLVENLRQIDVAGEAAYLESTNPANLQRYASVGFRPHGEVRIPGGGQLVTTMWRDPRV